MPTALAPAVPSAASSGHPALPSAAASANPLPWVAGVAMMAWVLFSPGVFSDGDTFWHVAAGEWILGHGAVPHADPFSHTRPGAPWVAHEWLTEALMALAYRAGDWLGGGGGWGGVVALTAAAAGLAFGQLARHLGRVLSPAPVLFLLLLAASCLRPVLLARPHIVTLPVLELWVATLFLARADGRGPPWRLLPLMTLWANMHGGFIVGLALVAPLGLEAVLAAAREGPGRWRAAALRWGGFGAAAALAACLTPHGPAGLLFPFYLSSMPDNIMLQEWQSPDFGIIQPIEMVLMAGLYVALSRGATLPPVRLALLLGLLHLALAHARHVTLVAVIAPFVVAGPLGQALAARRSAAAPVGGEAAGRAGWRPAGGWRGWGLAAAAVLVALRLALPVTPGTAATAPAAALAHVPPALAAQPVFNEYGFGGFLIHAGVRPFVDGRADMYGSDFMHRYWAVQAPDKAALDKAIAEYGIRWTLLPPGSPVVQLLDLMPGWCRLYADDRAVVHQACGDATLAAQADGTPRP